MLCIHIRQPNITFEYVQFSQKQKHHTQVHTHPKNQNGVCPCPHPPQLANNSHHPLNTYYAPGLLGVNILSFISNTGLPSSLSWFPTTAGTNNRICCICCGLTQLKHSFAAPGARSLTPRCRQCHAPSKASKRGSSPRFRQSQVFFTCGFITAIIASILLVWSSPCVCL